MAFKNIIFDLDGTLIDSSDGVVAAVNYSLRMMGDAEQPPEKIKPFIGFPLSQMYPHFSSAPVNELYAHFQSKSNDLVVGAAIPLDGADEVLAELSKRGRTMGIATTKVKENIAGVLDKLNWRDYFAVAVGGDEVKSVKPAPDVFLEAIRRLDANPSDCLIVGDTINDVVAAKAVPAKILAIKSPYGGFEKVVEAGPDYTADHLKELLGILELE